MGFFTRLLRPRKQQTHIAINLPTGVMTLYVEIHCGMKAKDNYIDPDMYYYYYSEARDKNLRQMNEESLKEHGLSGFKLRNRLYVQNCACAIDCNIRGYNFNTSKDIELFMKNKH